MTGDKIEIDIRKVILSEMERLSPDKFMEMIEIFNNATNGAYENNIIIDNKPLTINEKRAVIAFIRHYREAYLEDLNPAR